MKIPTTTLAQEITRITIINKSGKLSYSLENVINSEFQKILHNEFFPN